MMARKYDLAVSLVLIAWSLAALPAHAQSDERYTIMKPERPEPWLLPKYKSPRGTQQKVVLPKPAAVPQVRRPVPPSIHVPETGRVLPNLPAASGSGPGSSETYQDRAARCAHQAGVYGPAAGDRNAYIGGCINQ
jgi:hypothetical protein